MAINPQQTFVHLSSDGIATAVPGGDAFWSLPEADMAAFGQGWLFAEIEFDSDWRSWEMHPHGDELVYLLAGAVDFHLQQPHGLDIVELRDRGAVLVPRGVWHTAKTRLPSRMLFLTRGEGTQNRPV